MYLKKKKYNCYFLIWILSVVLFFLDTLIKYFKKLRKIIFHPKNFLTWNCDSSFWIKLWACVRGVEQFSIHRCTLSTLASLFSQQLAAHRCIALCKLKTWVNISSIAHIKKHIKLKIKYVDLLAFPLKMSDLGHQLGMSLLLEYDVVLDQPFLFISI